MIKIRKVIIETINTDKYAYLLEDGTVVPEPEIGREYIVLPRISGGVSNVPTILVGASGACEKHLKESYYLVEFCNGYRQLRYTYPQDKCEFCTQLYSHLYLRNADLVGANLSKANLEEANLSKANLYKANLVGANLSKANLEEANLSKANLYGAYLEGADLSGAYYSKLTKFPEGFKIPKSMVLV